MTLHQDDFLSTSEVLLYPNWYRSRVDVCQKTLDRSSLITRQRILQEAHNRMTLELEATIYGKEHPEQHLIRFPANWWEAVKERFAPSWFRDRYPVKFTEISTKIQELYPDFRPAMPDNQPAVRILVKKQENFPIW